MNRRIAKIAPFQNCSQRRFGPDHITIALSIPHLPIGGSIAISASVHWGGGSGGDTISALGVHHECTEGIL